MTIAPRSSSAKASTRQDHATRIVCAALALALALLALRIANLL